MRKALLLAFALIISPAAQLLASDMGEPLDTGSVPLNLRPRNLDQVSIEQRLGAQVPVDLSFRDGLGRSVRLGEIVNKKPVILTLAYFRCPGLCSLVLNGVADTVKQLPNFGLVLGRDYRLLTVSIDPEEGPRLALAKQRSYLARLGRESSSDVSTDWRMLTGREREIRALADAVGFHYVYDLASGQYSHASVAIVLTPQGRVSQYLFGIRYPAAAMAQALHSSTTSTPIGAPIQAFLLYCFHYDPLRGAWSLRIFNIFQLLGILTLLGLGGMFVNLQMGKKT
jgi:protein SCO1/2